MIHGGMELMIIFFRKYLCFRKMHPNIWGWSHMPTTVLNSSETKNDSRIKNAAIGNH